MLPPSPHGRARTGSYGIDEAELPCVLFFPSGDRACVRQRDPRTAVLPPPRVWPLVARSTSGKEVQTIPTHIAMPCDRLAPLSNLVFAPRLLPAQVIARGIRHLRALRSTPPQIPTELTKKRAKPTHPTHSSTGLEIPASREKSRPFPADSPHSFRYAL